MASRTPLDKQIKSVLKYDVSRPYLGKFKFSDLYSAQATLRRGEYHDENYQHRKPVYVGRINGDVICGALWRLMEYNPRRYFSNPFWYSGKMNIYKFVADTTLPADILTAKVISGVRGKLYDFLHANATTNGQWNDEIQTENGFVYTVLNDGRTGPMYRKLCLLRDAIKIITAQNVTDFESKRKPYREFIIQAVQRMHPEIFTGVKVPAHTDNDNVKDEIVSDVQNLPSQDDTQQLIDFLTEVDKIYDRMDSLQITLDNRDSVSSELYQQAYDEMQHLRNELAARKYQPTL